MNITYIQTRLQEIRDIKHDYEAAHSLEDKLFYDFIDFIAEDKRMPLKIRLLAFEVLKSSSIDFARYTA